MIKILDATANPIQHMGKVSGCCYNSDIDNPVKNFKRGMRCLKDGHGRVLEYPDVTLEISNYSARCIRELYTAMIGVSKLQASTRYITYDSFDYYTPDCLQDNKEYHRAMNNIAKSYELLIESGVDKEHAANLLPLGMTSKTVIKINYRALLHLAEIRLCSRAYIEIQNMVNEIIEVVSSICEEWETLMTYMKPKCKTCTEKHNCPKNKAI